MKLVDMVCPNCGAKIQADADMGSAKCEHCGSTFLLDDEAVHVKYDNLLCKKRLNSFEFIF